MLGSYTRRRLVAGGTVLALSVTACSADGSDGDDSGSSGEIVVRAVGGGVGEALRGLANDFTDETGVSVIYSEGTSSESLAAIRAAGGEPDADLVMINSFEAVSVAREDLAEPVDTELVSALADSHSTLVDEAGSWVVTGLTAVAPAYNPDAFADAGLEPIESWYDLWQPGLEGGIAMSSLPASGFTKAFFDLMVTLEGSPDAAFERFVELRPNMVTFTSSSTQARELFQQGDAIVLVAGNNHIFQVEGAPVEMARPQEGLLALEQGFFIPKGAANVEAAADFLNFLLGEEAQLAMAELFYGPANSTVTLPEEVAGQVPYQADVTDIVVPDFGRLIDNEDEWVERWTIEVEG